MHHSLEPSFSGKSPLQTNTHVINIASDFTDTPFGRYRADGEESGQVFRDDMLIPALKKFAHVTILLDGLEGLPSSVWEEVMGGLIRKEYELAWLKEHLAIETSEAEMRTYVRLGWKHAEEEAARKKAN